MVTNKNNMRQVLSVGSCDNVYIRGDMHGAKDDLSLGFNGLSTATNVMYLYCLLCSFLHSRKSRISNETI